MDNQDKDLTHRLSMIPNIDEKDAEDILDNIGDEIDDNNNKNYNQEDYDGKGYDDDDDDENGKNYNQEDYEGKGYDDDDDEDDDDYNNNKNDYDQYNYKEDDYYDYKDNINDKNDDEYDENNDEYNNTYNNNDDENDIESDDDENESDDDINEDVEGLPIFASQKAKDLNEDNKKKQEAVEKLQNDIIEMKERVRIMREHLKNVHQEVSHTNSLVDAKNKEAETESHLMQLTRRELGRYRNDIKRIETNIAEAQDKLNAVQNNIFKGNERIDSIKLQANWNQEEYEQWVLAVKQKEEDNLVLQKYARADEVRIREMTLQIERLNKVLLEKKNQLETESVDSRSKQIELDKIAEDFKALHFERQKLIEQWQESIDLMRRRDEEINEVALEYHEIKSRKEDKESILNDNQDRLKLQIDENNEVESKINMLERTLQKKRELRLTENEKIQELRDQLDVIRNELTNSANNLIRKRTENDNLNQEVEDKKIQLENTRRNYQILKRKLENESKSTDNVEASAKMAEDELQSKELEERKQDNIIAKYKESMFKESQELYELRQVEANHIAEISGAQASNRNLQSKLRQLDQESIRQQELIYSAEFEIQLMERKVARGLGERTDEEKKVLTKKIKELEGTLETIKDQKRMIQNQLRHIKNELKTASRKKEKAIEGKIELEEKLKQIELENRSEEQTYDASIKKKEKIMIENDLLRIEVKRLKNILTERTDAMFDLENRRQQLELSMEERRNEVKVHHEVQITKIRSIEDEKHKLILELGQRKQQVQKLKNKYEILTKTNREEEADGEMKSQAYYILKGAQKREELQREGDELDQEIRRKEREVRALQYTLDHLNVRNTNFRQSFQKANMESKEGDELQLLEQQVKTAKDTLFKKKKELQRLQTDIEDDEGRFNQVIEQKNRLDEQNNHLLNAKEQVQAEIQLQQELMEKISKRLERLKLNYREKHGYSTNEESLLEKRCKIDDVSDSIQNILFTLNQLSHEFPEINEHFEDEVSRYNLKIPSKPPSRSGYNSSKRRNNGRPLSARSDISDTSQYSERSDSSFSTSSNISKRSKSSRKNKKNHNNKGKPIGITNFDMGDL